MACTQVANVQHASSSILCPWSALPLTRSYFLCCSVGLDICADVSCVLMFPYDHELI